MENKNTKAGLSAILWTVIVMLLCSVPLLALDVDGTLDLDYAITDDWVNVYGGELNMKLGAHVEFGIYADGTSTVNIYAGTIGSGQKIQVDAGATVTVYGTNFTDSQGTIDSDKWTPHGGSDTLTGTYANGNGDPINLLFWSDVPISLVDTAGSSAIDVQIDIKPGTYPNPINPGSNGLIPVAILTDGDFDAETVDLDTVTLAGREVAVRGKADKMMARMEDVDDDGDLDLMLQVDTQSEGAVWASGPVTLYGETKDGQRIQGTDSVIVVPQD